MPEDPAVWNVTPYEVTNEQADTPPAPKPLPCPIYVFAAALAVRPLTAGAQMCRQEQCPWWITYRCDGSIVGHCAVAMLGYQAADQAEARDGR